MKTQQAKLLIPSAVAHRSCAMGASGVAIEGFRLLHGLWLCSNRAFSKVISSRITQRLPRLVGHSWAKVINPAFIKF